MEWHGVRNTLKYIREHSPLAHTPYTIAAAFFLVCTLATVLLFANQGIVIRIAHTYKNTALVIASVLVDLTNQDRATNDLHTLSVHPLLVAAAQAKANDMAARGYFAHFDAEGKAPWDWIHESGYAYRYAGENLAIQFSDSEDVRSAWLASPTHRANLLDSRFTEVGIAVATGLYEGRPTVFVVQMFGTPKDVLVLPSEMAEEVVANTQTQTDVAEAVSVAQPGSEEGGEDRAAQAQIRGLEADVFVLGLAEIADDVAKEEHAPTTKEEVVNPKLAPEGVTSVFAEPVLVVADSNNVSNLPASFISRTFASPWFSFKTILLSFLSILTILMLYAAVQEWFQGHKSHLRYAASLSVAYAALFVLLGSATSPRDTLVPPADRVAFTADETPLVFAQVGTTYTKEELLALREVRERRAEVQSAAVSASLSNPTFQRTFLVLFIIIFLYGGWKLALERYYKRGKSL